MMTPRGMANLDLRGMIGRIYVENHLKNGFEGPGELKITGRISAINQV